MIRRLLAFIWNLLPVWPHPLNDIEDNDND